MTTATVIGDGGWGTALALVLHANGHEVRVWGPFSEYIDSVRNKKENTKFLPGVELPDGITWTTDRQQAVDGADVVVLAIPSKFYHAVVESLSPFIPASSEVVSVTKGLSKETHQRMTDVAQGLLGRTGIAALSGPSHAEEVARTVPTAVVLACENHETAQHLQQVFANPVFRVYSSDDVVGVELGGALKNVIAIAAGISDGIGFGDNTKAALMTRGLAEMKRLGCALGARAATFSGLSGMGDLVVTCGSMLSRNRGVGERLGRGETIDEILDSMQQVAEGVWNCSNALALAEEKGIEVPITREVTAVIHERKDPSEAVRSLLARDPRPERD